MEMGMNNFGKGQHSGIGMCGKIKDFLKQLM